MAAEPQRLHPEHEHLTTLLDLARERDDEPDLDYPELVALPEADSRRQQQRRRRRP